MSEETAHIRPQSINAGIASPEQEYLRPIGNNDKELISPLERK